ncbi:phosphoribosylglycinamide formyltransferase [Segetibacter aerophilus]|uniref:Phosphoribosylglycinamide formyltransferase n=2 Tax=Segetibacter aerophilus TaxID=670293 RepID=A0A512BCD2_9BACT|nr:phosphoribosylglycinamide formyltransferase [Segetibacter aerophilus]
MSTAILPSQKNHSVVQIALFASGAGSNAKKIIEHFENSGRVVIKLVVCNKPGAGVVQIAADNNIPVLMIERERFFNGDSYLNELNLASIEFIVLAGFLWKIPETLIQNFRNRIINIHPALLPKFGGKGMYGSKVHEAVIAAGEVESGITIHYVDEHYDNGDVIFQAKCSILPTDTAESLAEKIHKLEHENFARVIEECVSKL